MAHLDTRGGDPHVGLPGPAHHRHLEVSTLSALDQDHVGAVVHAERDVLAPGVHQLVDDSRDFTGEELESSCRGGALLGHSIGQGTGHDVGGIVGAVVVLRGLEGPGPPDASRVARSGRRLEGCFDEIEVHFWSFSW